MASSVDNFSQLISPESVGWISRSSAPDGKYAATTEGCPLGYRLFILVNATLFIRPSEIVPGWEGLPIYQFLILGCLLASLPVVLPQLTWTSLRRNPVTLCVIGLLLAVILSHVRHGDFYSARMGATEFLKIVIYYLLLVGLIDSPARLRQFVLIIAGFVLIVAVLCLLNHYHVIDIPALADLNEGEGTDGPVVVRLRAMGIFNDPNDFCLILNFAIFVCLHRLLAQTGWHFKLGWALPIATLLYALVLTQSRGGFLSLLVGLVVLLFTRLPRKRAVLICAILFPAMLVAFAGRLTNIDVENSNDTAQGRIQLWRDSMVEFHGSPLFGIGQGNLVEEIGHVSHNSYVHSYAELGFFGGTLFVGAFYLAASGLGGLTVRRAPQLADDVRRLRLCLFPALAAYMMGIYSLSRPYGNATYLILGVMGALLVLARRAGAKLPQFDARLTKTVIIASVCCVFYLEVFIRIFAE